MSLVAAPRAFAQPEHFAIDPVHTRIAFTVDHSGFSNAIGTFAGISGTLDFDRGDWRSAKVEVAIPLDRLDMGDAKWKDKVLGASLLGVRQQAVARFVSTRVEPTGNDRALIHGMLSLRGHDTPVTLDAHLNALKRHPLTFRRTAGFSATATLSRKALQMGAYPDVIGDAVQLRIEVEAEAANVAPARTAPTDATTGTTKGGHR
jgi:polyisoprenoid-binding protein YceI